MNIKPQYSGAITREQFLYYESRIVAKMILQGKNFECILKDVMEENLFQYPSLASYRTITKACYQRLIFTGDKRIIELVANSNSSTSKFALLYCMMCQNLLVRDFMIDVVGEKYQSGFLDFGTSDVNHFFVQLIGRVDAIGTWSDATIKKIKSVLVKCLVDSGYLTTIKSTVLNPISVDEELINLIKDRGEYEFLQAFNEI